MFISIVIPTYNSKDCLEKALNSIFIQNYKDIEVVMVDNGSSDGTSELLKEQFPLVKLITNNQNEGSSFARNQGIELSKGDYILFMDSDTYLDKNFLANLRKVLDKLPSHIAGISPKILDAKSKKVFSCGLYVSRLYRVYDVGRDRASDAFPYEFTITGPNTCCAVFRRGSLEEVKSGGSYFDKDFFFLFEDADLALRLKKKGYLSVFAPSLLCYHDGNGSKTSEEFRRFLCFRNRWHMILKSKKNLRLMLFLLRSFLYDFPRTLHFVLTNRYSLVAFKDIYKKIKIQ